MGHRIQERIKIHGAAASFRREHAVVVLPGVAEVIAGDVEAVSYAYFRIYTLCLIYIIIYNVKPYLAGAITWCFYIVICKVIGWGGCSPMLTDRLRDEKRVGREVFPVISPGRKRRISGAWEGKLFVEASAVCFSYMTQGTMVKVIPEGCCSNTMV